jgi:hypothetical protein
MKKLVLILFLGILVYSCSQLSNSPSETGNIVANRVTSDTVPFPDFGYMLPATEYDGPIFKLSQNYPDTLPSDIPSFLSIDYKKDWKSYLEKAQDYCFEGNTDVDFRVENNQVRKWYHMPWQHTSNNGREGIHGLTQEAPVKKYQLAPTQTIQPPARLPSAFTTILPATRSEKCGRNMTTRYTIQICPFNKAPSYSSFCSLHSQIARMQPLRCRVSPMEYGGMAMSYPILPRCKHPILRCTGIDPK